MNSFWTALKRPFFVLAPMADVTDAAYRRLIAETAKPDVTWTEFVSADGLYHTREKQGLPNDKNPLVRDLAFTEQEHPIVAQLFTSDPKTMAYAAKLCKELGIDGIDINMGCPDRSIEKQGAGAAMIKQVDVAKAVIAAARTSDLPISIKTRLGYNQEGIDLWLAALLTETPAALTVHLRTRKEMSKVPAHWELMPRIIALRDTLSPQTLVIGNGDVEHLEDAHTKVAQSGADGAMLGRAIFGNPWVFAGRKPHDLSLEERLDALTKLATYFDELRPRKSFHVLKKHFKAYITGWPGAAEFRMRLMDASSHDELMPLLAAARRNLTRV